ncbi:MAG: cytochrome c [Mesorhizobium sp.]|nr:cytochrome c [bacterium M00.F.Ca.ET.205.01.1.1]TGU52249.1 cytochrome c [bacterium M00.F.Ca.ET.152.01.1.1]TGV35071.1 cytochrome c [Mesorhizobium sp. M00.F.Ca.ET.186.01.1.1]TGZ43024.1 cytochrome c [bacterium M00.F.Ca.ET.162.01.1.1]TJW34960.1 MAG: cytochrome c [Mesorhizobium sp.]
MFKLAATTLAAVLAAGVALAHMGATGIVAERMAAMKNMGRELKAIGDMLVGNAPFNAAAVARHADALHENCHRTTTLFPPGSIDHHSRALPAIWEKPEAFQDAMQKLHNATETFAATAPLSDRTALAASFEQIRKICNGCHQTFRSPDN